MVEFFKAIPELVLFGCAAILVAFAVMVLLLRFQAEQSRRRLRSFTSVFRDSVAAGVPGSREGISAATLEVLRANCEQLVDEVQRGWWAAIELQLEPYPSPSSVDEDSWFLTEKPRHILPFEVVGEQFHAAIFSAFPGLLTGAGLTLTFVAILMALRDVRMGTDPAAPITGIEPLINGLSGKFLSSIVALSSGIVFTLVERFTLRSLRTSHDQMIFAIWKAIPYLPPSRILLDIRRSSDNQAVSVSNISSEVVDRFVGAFNDQVVPGLASGVASGFSAPMEQMLETLESLKRAVVGLESQKQDSVTGEIRGLLGSLETSLVQALSKMGEDFHHALTGAANKEFGNVQGTLEATRLMLSDMNVQFTSMQAAFSTIIENAQGSASDQMQAGRAQTEALTALMNGLMVKMQESAEQNLGSVRAQLTLVVSDLATKVGALSQDMMAAADTVAKQAQNSANQVLDHAGEWSEATAKRLNGLLQAMEDRSKDIHVAGAALSKATDSLSILVAENANALGRMAEASRQVQAYSTGLAGQSEALSGISQLQSKVTVQLREASGTLSSAGEQNARILADYRRTLDEYKIVIDDLDKNLESILGRVNSGLRDYHQSIENNFNNLVKISNPMISEAASFLREHVKELEGQLEELGAVIGRSLERMDGRAK
jgi:hypothetical protein